MVQSILCTGGLGYIGSHTVVSLANNGYDEIVIIDNCSNSNDSVYTNLKLLVPEECTLYFYLVDLCDRESLRNVFMSHSIDVVMHFAALKSVGDSCQKPIKYYENNIISTMNLLHVMNETNCKNMVYSSSATIYKHMEGPLKEDALNGPSNPYGHTKQMTEQILQDVVSSDNTWNIICLRYFNPVGCHKSGLIRDQPIGVPSNLFPYISQVLSGTLKELTIHGNDYDTPDGTCLRDYVHVEDIAMGHISALRYIESRGTRSGICDFFNLGSGECYSVLDVVKAFEQMMNGIIVPCVIGTRRTGDVSSVRADVTKANSVLKWYPTNSLDDAISSILIKKV